MSFVTVCGRLGRDADLRQGDDPSKSVANFSVAEDIGYGDKKRTQWWACALWGTRAEKIVTYLMKGTPVTVVGNPELRTFTKKDGTQGSELTVRVVDIVLQGRGSAEDSPSRSPPPAAAAPASSRTSADVAKDGDFDDDIPF